ncbi:hypothetical protein [Aquisphaera insulae]|uniref:hypothetical protein n=1 Tax=Aquisphaera insulae TaxID=2712864 RepID=UPI0013ECEC48|nr:hypothetical protein [Aquisphaera insulae]
MNGSGGLQINGAQDSHYALTTAPSGSGYGPNTFVADHTKYPLVSGPWVPNTTSAQWIGPVSDRTTIPGSTGSGDSAYETTFDLTGLDASTARITGKWSTDNPGEIWLNGVSTGIATIGEFAYQSMQSFSITTGFQAGTNTLEFKVNNKPIDSNNPTGLIVEMTGTAAVPEPASVSLGLISIVGCLAGRRWMRRSRKAKAA